MAAKWGGLASVLVIVGVALTSLVSPVWAVTHRQSVNCTHFVDNAASSDGDGSQARPWDSIADHVDELSPGDVMCIRGDQSAPGRVYSTRMIELNQSGTANQPITIQPYGQEKVVIRNIQSDVLLAFHGVQYWIVQGLTLDHRDRWSRAILFRENADHNILRNNEIKNGRSDGVVVSSGATGNIIEGNHIHDFVDPDPSKDAHCILIQTEADDTFVYNNTMYDCSGDGVQLLDNRLASREPADGVQIVENLFYRGTIDKAENAIDIKAAVNLTISANRVHGYFDTSAIVLQKGSRNVLFEGNTVYDSARGFNIHAEGGESPEGVTLSNNLIYDVTDYAILVSGVRDGAFVHNTIVNAEWHSFRVVLRGLRGGRFQNNLVFDSGSAQLKNGVIFSDVSVGHNGWFNTEADSVFTASSDVVSGGDPGFVDAAGHDYHLTSASPARDAGTDVGVTTDFEGDARPWGTHPDIGADECVLDLNLVAIPGDRRIRLSWTEFQHPDLASYAINYTYGPGGRDAAQGPAPILGIPPATRDTVLTGLANFVPYAITVIARDGNQADLAVSNRLVRMPTNIFVFMPLTLKRHR